MSLVSDLLPVVNAGRQLAADLGLRTRAVVVRTRTWSGGKVGSGTASDADVTLTPPPVVSEPPARLVGDAVGMYEAGDIIVTKIARDTYTEAQLMPAVSAGVEVLYLVSDPDTGVVRQYRLVGAPTNVNFAWGLTLRRLDRRQS